MTRRDAIRGVERRWASRRALLEPCLRCGRVELLMPVYGRKGGTRLCLSCGHAQRRGEAGDLAEAVVLTLFDGERGGAR
jgi:hypothetical protein